MPGNHDDSRIARDLTQHDQAFQDHVKQFYASPEFKAAEKASEPFFKLANDFVFGRPTTLENAVSA